jgi:hypothetical protein
MSDPTPLLDSIIEPEAGGFSPEHARYVLSLSFPKAIQEQYRDLSEKARLGTLSEPEQVKLDEFLSTNAFLMILKSKARVSLKQHGSAA